MGFIEITEEMMNKAFTENGGVAYKTTGSYCLDYFSVIGGMRYNPTDALNLFMKAYKENPTLAIKILFYLRDIRNGLGERNLFRLTINLLANMYPLVCAQIINYIPTLGRWDDLLSCYDTPIRKEVVKLIKDQLKEDVKLKEENKPISLLAKWMPSINTSSYETKSLALRLSDSLGLKKEEYRKMLSYLRKDLIVENNLRERDYTFNYSNLPGNALFKYRNCFTTNDNERYTKYLEDVKNNKVKINSTTIYPYEIIRKFDDIVMYGRPVSKAELNTLNTIFSSFNRNEVSGKTLVVRDGSYSMYDQTQVSANSVATSLTMLFSERLTGEFKDKFITFSSKPQLIKIKGSTPFERYESIVKYHDPQNTNIQSVYDLILNVYNNKHFKQEDALDRIVIISDMEFDNIEEFDDTSYNYFKTKFNELGFDLPKVIFWNVRCRNVQFPANMEDDKVILVSGASPLVIDSITKNDGKSAYDYMLLCLEPYKYLDTIKF